MIRRSVEFLGILAVIVLLSLYENECRASAPGRPAVALQTPAKRVAKKKTVAQIDASPVAQLGYSEKEYQFLRQRHKPPSSLAEGPLPAPELEGLATNTRLNIVIDRKLWPVVKEVIYGKTAALENRLDAGLSPDSVVIMGYPYNSCVSLLALAVRAGQRGIIEVLLAHDARVNPPSVELSEVPPNGEILPFAGPLAIAAQYGEDDVVRTLLQRGANVNQRIGMGDRDYSALAEAIYSGSPATVYLLLTHGADITSLVGTGVTVPDSLINYYQGPRTMAIRRLLIQYGAKMPTTH